MKILDPTPFQARHVKRVKSVVIMTIVIIKVYNSIRLIVYSKM